MKLQLNLATRPYVNRRRLLLGYLLALGGLAVVAVVLVVLSLKSRHRIDETAAQMAELRKRADLDQAGAASVAYTPAAQAELDQHILFANQLLERDHFYWTQLFDQLEEVSLAGIGIRQLQPDFKTGLVKISGTAADLGRLRQLLDRLADSPYFSDVRLLQQARDAKEGTIDFSLTLRRRGK